MRRALTMAGLLMLIATAASAQSPFEEIHSDVLRKFEVRRALALTEGTRLLAPDPTPGQLLYDAIHYEIDIAIRFVGQEVEGSVTILLESLVDSLFVVDIDADMALSIHGVTQVGSFALPFSHASNIISVDLSPGLALGEQIELRIDYNGYPSSAVEPGLFFRTYNSRQVIYSLSEPWGARSWWPCKDYPDDKATFDLYFAVPSAHFAASNGSYIGESDVERWGMPFKRYHWQENYLMPTYLASIAATEYVRLDDYWIYAVGGTLAVHHYVYPELVAQATEDLNITVPMIQFYSGYFGTYPFTDDKYGVALCNIGGGMEHQTLTSYGYYFIIGNHSYDWLFAHELAHQWFGDLITCKDWTHIWLNEGFASYAEALWFEHLDGPAALKDYMDTMDNPSYWNGPIMREPDNSDPWYYFDSVVYDKGAWLLHMLRHVVGETDFRNILRSYVADTRYRFSVAETDDLIAICESFYGSPLNWFFDPWLTRTDRLEYRWSWSTYTQAGGEYLTVSIDQVQTELYTMPVDFRIQTSAGQLDTIFWVSDRHEEFQLVLGDPVLDVQLDPDHWILCTRSETTTGAEAVPTAAFLDQNFPNPFNPVTTIRFGLPEAGNVIMRVYDVRGAFVATLAQRRYDSGTHEVTWNGTNQRGERASSGLYFYRLQTPEGVLTRKMLLLR